MEDELAEWLSGDALALALYMHELSEEAYCASWHTGLEEALWAAIHNGKRKFGFITISDEQIAELKRLSDACGGWCVWFDYDCLNQVALVPIDEWTALYESRRASDAEWRATIEARCAAIASAEEVK